MANFCTLIEDVMVLLTVPMALMKFNVTVSQFFCEPDWLINRKSVIS